MGWNDDFSVEAVRGLVASLLPENTAFDDSDNLLAAGLDSLKIMKLVGRWRKSGVKVSFAQCISRPSVADWARLLASAARRQSGSSKESEPACSSGPFPLTDIQQAYLLGRSDGQVLGGIGCHAYLEISGEALSPERLQKAWKSLLRAHPMLRDAFDDDGTQHFVEHSPAEELAVYDFRTVSDADAVEELESIRAGLSRRRLAVEKGETAALGIALLPDGSTRLFFDAEMLALDVGSLCLVLDGLAAAYSGEEPAFGGDFSEWLRKDGCISVEEEAAARKYWEDRIDFLPEGPALPLERRPEDITDVFVTRRRRSLSGEAWEGIARAAKQYSSTPATLVLAAYAEVLSRWSGSDRFLINMPLSDRRNAPADLVGEFTRVELLEADLGTGAAFADHLRAIGEQLYHDMDHTAFSGVRVLREMAKRRGGASAPVVFAGNVGTELLSERARGILGEVTFMISQTPQVWLDFQMYSDGKGGQTLVWDAVDGLFPEGMLESMFDALHRMLIGISEISYDRDKLFAASPEKLMGAVGRPYDDEPFVVPMEDYPERLHQMVFEYAEKNPSKTALVDTGLGEAVSFGELCDHALRIASFLRGLGVGRGDLVAVTLPRGRMQIEAVLGVLAAGAAYAPVSVEQPYMRRCIIHQKAGIRFAVSDSEHIRLLSWPEGCCLVNVREAVGSPKEKFHTMGKPNDTAYVIFTSGSTGEPKGVEISHCGAINTIVSVNSLCGVSDRDTALAVSAMDFDLSVYDVFGVLGSGGTLVLLSEETRRDADAWKKFVSEYGVTLWNSVPMLLDMLVTAASEDGTDISCLRKALLSGDWIPMELPGRLLEKSPGCIVAAMGGATEASIWSNIYLAGATLGPEWKSVPYGRPLPGQSYRIMDARGRDCPDWTQGELWIGGLGVAVGYRGDCDRTAQSFVERNGRRWYRTGDMGRFHACGLIEFLGRRDAQVKLRGHRIELGEIEAVLRACSSVREAAVAVVRDGGGADFLVGYVVPRGDGSPSPEFLVEWLRDRVPSYMVVSRFVYMERLPLSANGKVDRKRLPSAEYAVSVKKAGRAPANEWESRLISLWKTVLPESGISPSDNFFDVGGDSLLAIRLVSAVRKEFGIAFGVDSVLKYSTVEEMAKQIERSSASERPQEGLPSMLQDPEHAFDPFPLTDVQQSYIVGHSGAYALGKVASRYYCEMDVDPDLSVDVLREGWMRLVDRHGMMRAVITEDGRQRILEKVSIPDMPLRDISGLANQENVLLGLRKSIPVEDSSPYEWPLFSLSFTRWKGGLRAHVSFDNVVYDGRTVMMLIREWGETVRGAEFPPIKATFRDYVRTMEDFGRSRAAESDRAYWMEKIDRIFPAPALPLAVDPAELGRPVFTRHGFNVSKKEAEALRLECTKRNLTLSGLLLAAYSEILARWSSSSKFTINLTMFNRVPFDSEVALLAGDFTSLTLLSVDMSKSIPFDERAALIQEQLWKDLSHPYTGGVAVMREIAARKGGEAARMPVVFTSGLGLDDRAGSPGGHLAYALTQTPQVWIDHQITGLDGGGMQLAWDAVDGLFPDGMVDEMFAAYERLVRRLAADSEAWFENRPERLSESFEAVLQSVNSTRGPLPGDTLLARLENCVKKIPGSDAVIGPDKILSYRELYARARIVADMIVRRAGRAPVVAVVMKKGWEQAVACAAALIAGGCWLPVEADLPQARVDAILGDSGASAVLIQPEIESMFVWPEGIPVISVDGNLPQENMGNLLVGPSPKPSDTAYIIYTSGSTGRPKGVVISHTGALNTIDDINERFGVRQGDRLFALSHLGFDLSVYDMWGAFVAGAACVMPEHGMDRDPSRWLPLIERHGVTVWNSVPALMQMMSGYLEAAGLVFPNSLRLVLLSGDWIPVGLPAQIRKQGCNAEIISLGGATEASIWSIFYAIGEVPPDWKSIPYGRPLRNQRFHVYDESLQERPFGIAGELYIAGDGLALCYHNDPDRTDASFITHPETGERLYRTGDLGRRFADGTLEFLGRADFQVKLRGFRIELGEIENAACRVSGVSEAAAVMAGTTESDKKIVLFLVCDGGEQENPERKVLDECSGSLPGYMVPADVVLLREIPLSANGKVDRKRLLELAGTRRRDRPVRENASGEKEKAIAKLWGEVLGHEHFGVTDNFFEAGGTSVLAIRLYKEISSAFPMKLPLVSVFEYPTVRSFAVYLDSLEGPKGTCTEKEDSTARRIAMRRKRMISE